MNIIKWIKNLFQKKKKKAEQIEAPQQSEAQPIITKRKPVNLELVFSALRNENIQYKYSIANKLFTVHRMPSSRATKAMQIIGFDFKIEGESDRDYKLRKSRIRIQKESRKRNFGV